MSTNYVDLIKNARVYDVARKTPLDPAPALSVRFENNIFLKREDLQPVFSFKCRGAYNKMVNLTEDERAMGVVAASAGNHAQGVALAARHLGIDAKIVMPTTTPDIKVNAVRMHGGITVLHGDSYDDAYAHARELADKEGRVFIHPYDDPLVIAGQGTVAVEMLEQKNDGIDAVFVPIGGGGLIAGVGVYLKMESPRTKVIGVEPVDAASMHDALQKNKRITLKQVGLFADGVAVRQAGETTFEIARKVVDEVILVDTDEICAAIKDIYEDTRSIVEPAGALAVAGLKKYVEREKCEHQCLIAIQSGANINFDRLRHVAERATLGEHREALFAVEIPERPGSFLDFCHVIGQRSVTEFNYRYSDTAAAHVFAGIELREGEPERVQLQKTLEEHGYRVVDMTHNEMAKLHVRYMVGGHAPNLQNEKLYRFEFPERPGALLNFLSGLGTRWNISLFHYRNHGAAFGRVLVGVQIEDGETGQFQSFLDDLRFTYWEETDNPAYKLFVGTKS